MPTFDVVTFIEYFPLLSVVTLLLFTSPFITTDMFTFESGFPNSSFKIPDIVMFFPWGISLTGSRVIVVFILRTVIAVWASEE